MVKHPHWLCSEIFHVFQNEILSCKTMSISKKYLVLLFMYYCDGGHAHNMHTISLSTFYIKIFIEHQVHDLRNELIMNNWKWQNNIDDIWMNTDVHVLLIHLSKLYKS